MAARSASISTIAVTTKGILSPRSADLQILVLSQATSRRSQVGYSAPRLVPGQEHAVGKRPGLHQVQVHPVVQGREERRAAAYQDRVGDDRVLVDQPGSHGRRGEGGAADVHGTAILSLEPGDLGDSVAGDQAGVPVD